MAQATKTEDLKNAFCLGAAEGVRAVAQVETQRIRGQRWGAARFNRAMAAEVRELDAEGLLAMALAGRE